MTPRTEAELRAMDRMVLRHAKGLLERGWTRHTSARAHDRRQVSEDDPDARFFCATAANWRAARELFGYAWAGAMQTRTGHAVVAAARALRPSRPPVSLPTLNDFVVRSKRELLRAYDAALAERAR